MKQTGYYYQVYTVFELSRAELDFIIEVGCDHYDFKCKAACRSGPSGFLYDCKVSMGEDDSVEVTLSNDQLQLIHKILEMAHSYPGCKDPNLLGLWFQFGQLVKANIQESQRINE